MSQHVAHWDDVAPLDRAMGDIGARWWRLGEAVRSVEVGLRRLLVYPGKRSTPYHAHGAEEEIFVVLGGEGLLLDGESCCAVARGDLIVHRAGGTAHTLRAGPEGLDVLAFGERSLLPICHLPRTNKAYATSTTVLPAPPFESLYEHDAAPLRFPDKGERLPNVVRLGEVEPERVDRPRARMTVRKAAVAAGAVRSGLRVLDIDPGAEGYPPHCHSVEEELFVVTAGTGTLYLDGEAHDVRTGHVISRPAATGVAHQFVAGDDGLSLLAYGTRRAADVTYYPRSGKVALRGVGVIGRLETCDYWDGED